MTINANNYHSGRFYHSPHAMEKKGSKMTLNMLQKGQSATIVSVNAEKELKNRFNSFGIVKNATVYALEHTLTRQTIKIRVNKTRMALRYSEAEKVEIRT
jgi:ferrous iron transport protein A